MQHERHRVPVTAVAFWRDDVLLAGEGSILSAYDVQNKRLLASVNIFDGQAIHGIISSNASDGRLLLLGGRYVRALTLSQNEHIFFKLGTIAEANDWILDAAFSDSNSDGICRAAIVTAHSALTIAAVDHALDTRLEDVVPGSNCILYTAQVTWLSPFKCLIASGTAFGDIIVWSSDISEHNGKHSAIWQTHYTFSAHDGSVFGIQIGSGEIAVALGSEKHVLASCSDDRTIRLWNISDLSSRSPAISETQRETGFGSKPIDETHAPPCIAKVMGHISRIWHVRLLYGTQGANSDQNAAKGDPVRLFSFGEDATCISWSLDCQHDSSSTPQYAFQQTNVERAHNGKNIWSVALGTDSRIATGAADGAISVLSMLGTTVAGRRKRLTIHSESGQSRPDLVRSYSFISATEVLAITDQGNILRLSVESDGASRLVRVSDSCSDAVRGYSICTGDHSAGFFAGMNGNVYAYDAVEDRCYQVAKTERKVVGLYSQRIALNDKKGHAVLITNIGLPVALCLQISSKEGRGDMTAVKSIQLNLPDKSFVVTSFAQNDVPGCSFAILGSRSGSVAIYKLETQSNGGSSDAVCCASVHGKEAVTSLKVFATPHGNDVHILSTGRDGTFAISTFEADTKSAIHLTRIHQLLLPFGPNIEGQDCIGNSDIRVWGFRSKSFVVYDISSQREIMNVECGGVHRNWTFEPAINGGTFLWTQASNLYYQRQSSLPFDLLNSGGHGREIKTMATAPTKAGLMIATGAEDTNIKLWLRSEDGSWRCLHTLFKHNTGIQNLWWSQNGEYLFSSGGFEEFFVWRIRYDVPKLGIGVYQNRKWTLLASGSYLASCLTQCLKIKASKCFLTASTDGHLAAWNMKSLEAKWCWISRHQVHQNAVLSMISHSNLIITGGDDNALGFTFVGERDFDSLVVPRAHSAAVTALAVVRNELNRFWLVTASIDQRVKLWQIDVADVGREGVEGIKIKLVQNSFTAVADVSSMEAVVLEDGRVAVVLCGVGMDVWRIDKDLSVEGC
ncbi:uncharacterized protein MYCFIDRAFT_27910 [Pseudocercospora fijiensis CIRAD86]|uniref:Uncharacterized protein n=1 Tax=Pseudocercospora fijiensis (strain CIRAD86) TaxID=383855 RepID=N1Q5Y0_PSEFD|nr:uncharacterized protein MYCFIDRAFT_27910 [Pseudocercospora fijiensis CIRAD86]EME87510.1 hypothetical protein MYCFIDRAFT_27910 [Pseudocercospora fijiensis CIRAD86]